MRILQHVCSVVIALWAIPVAHPKTLALHPLYERPGGHSWHSLSKRSLSASGPSSGPSSQASPSALVARSHWKGQDVVAVDGEPTTTPAAANAEEVTTEEPYEAGDGGDDFGADILNTLLEVVGALLSFFTDPPGAIQKMVEQAQKLTGGARALMATVRRQQLRQRQAGLPAVPGLDSLPVVLEQVQRLTNAAVEIAKLGPVGARAARGMLEEAKRILETAKGLVEAGGKVAGSARKVAESISRPWGG